MKQVYAVKIVYKNGNTSYHSVWSTYSAAKRQAALRNGFLIKNPLDCGYKVYSMKPLEVGVDFWNISHVKFKDSMGFLPILYDI